MKTAVLFVLLLLGCSTSMRAQATKTFVQLHQMPEHITTLHLELSSDKVELVRTKSSRISIETTVHLAPGSLPLLDYIAKSGRYDLQASSSNHSSRMVLALHQTQKVLVIKGELCNEEITYKIHVPERLLKITTSYSAVAASIAE
jgi:hypothetical protein